MLIGWIDAEFRYVCADAMGKSARTDGGKIDASATVSFDRGPEPPPPRLRRSGRAALRVRGKVGAASAAALKRNWRRSTDMMILRKKEVSL